MVNTSSFGRFEVVTLLVVSIAAGGVIIPAVTTATGGLTDTGGSQSQATEINTSSTVTDKATPNTANWYAVDLKAGQGFTAQIHPDSAVGELNVALYGPDGVPVQSPQSDENNAPDGQTARGTVVERTGTHYVKVTATKPSSAGPVPYELSVSTTQLDQHDPNEKLSQAVTVTPGTKVTGVMTGYDRDYFSIKATAGDTLSVATTASGGSIDRVAVFGPDGGQIHESSGGNVKAVQLPKDGRYIVQPVADLDTTKSLDYSFQVRTSANRTSANRTNAEQSRQITPGNAVRGTTTSTPTTYTVNLTEGDGLNAALTHRNRTNHSASLSFSISAPDGTEIGTVPADSRGAYRTTPGTTTAVGGAVAEQTGTYTITVTGPPGANYSLSVETDRLDKHDPNEHPRTATTIDGNTTTSGVLTGYDRDVYAINLESGQTVSVSSTGGGGFALALWVAGPNTTDQSHDGQKHSFGADSITGTSVGTNLTFTANRSGTHFIKVVPHPNVSSAPMFFKSAPYELTTTVSNGVSMLNISTADSTTITPPTTTESTNTTTRTPNETLTAPITVGSNRSTPSPLQSNQPTAERPMINVGTGTLFALASVFAAFVGVGVIEWWRQSGGQR